MITLTMTFGQMPTEEQFNQAWSNHFGQHINHIAEDSGRDLFSFGNDKRVGTDELTQSQVWAEINKAHEEYEQGDDAAGAWVSAVLFSLGIEWV
jgi:hypothetical protein